MNAMIEMQVGYVQVYAAAQERQRAHAEPHQETDQIKSRPGHERLLGLGAEVAGGAFKTSIRRSANPGFSKIVPNRIRHIRESSCLATASSARCRSASRLKCSAPEMSHKSSLSSGAPRSLISSLEKPSGSSTRRSEEHT